MPRHNYICIYIYTYICIYTYRYGNNVLQEKGMVPLSPAGFSKHPPELCRDNASPPSSPDLPKDHGGVSFQSRSSTLSKTGYR